jgi:phosphoglycolate phosphatase-like HAD superfamily hydrolase
VASETKLGNPALEARVKQDGEPELARALRWSQAVNEAVKQMVRGVPPFPFVRKSLERLAGLADMLVVSATPMEALIAEWQEHGIASFVTAICGQESGSKRETLINARKYSPGHTLMIGDAPGDLQAAEANQCLFFPINPGEEEASWRSLFEEGIDRFLNRDFAGAYQTALLERFHEFLPEKPTWPVTN